MAKQRHTAKVLFAVCWPIKYTVKRRVCRVSTLWHTTKRPYEKEWHVALSFAVYPIVAHGKEVVRVFLRFYERFSCLTAILLY